MPPRRNLFDIIIDNIRSVGYLLLGGFNLYIGCLNLLENRTYGFISLVIGFIIFGLGLKNLIEMWST